MPRKNLARQERAPITRTSIGGLSPDTPPEELISEIKSLYTLQLAVERLLREVIGCLDPEANRKARKQIDQLLVEVKGKFVEDQENLASFGLAEGVRLGIARFEKFIEGMDKAGWE